MRYVKLFEEFEAYNEFGLEDSHNIEKAKSSLKTADIQFSLTSGGGITFFVFNNADDLEVATSIVSKVIDKTKEPEWE
jgi:hypothetical protein